MIICVWCFCSDFEIILEWEESNLIPLKLVAWSKSFPFHFWDSRFLGRAAECANYRRKENEFLWKPVIVSDKKAPFLPLKKACPDSETFSRKNAPFYKVLGNKEWMKWVRHKKKSEPRLSMYGIVIVLVPERVCRNNDDAHIFCVTGEAWFGCARVPAGFQVSGLARSSWLAHVRHLLCVLFPAIGATPWSNARFPMQDREVPALGCVLSGLFRITGDCALRVRFFPLEIRVCVITSWGWG